MMKKNGAPDIIRGYHRMLHIDLGGTIFCFASQWTVWRAIVALKRDENNYSGSITVWIIIYAFMRDGLKKCPPIRKIEGWTIGDRIGHGVLKIALPSRFCIKVAYMDILAILVNYRAFFEPMTVLFLPNQLLQTSGVSPRRGLCVYIGVSVEHWANKKGILNFEGLYTKESLCGEKIILMNYN